MNQNRFLSSALLLAAGIALLSAVSCAPGKKTAKNQAETDLKLLVAYMVGDFNSTAQSQRDSSYFDIRLHIRPIWAKDKGNHWLYVEQATAAAESKPYRQRVYKVESDGANMFRSMVYTLPDPAEWAGKYKSPEAFDKLSPSDLTLRDGCTVFLAKNEKGYFVGATRGDGCESNLRGAKYAVSTVTITPTMLLSWDQGFDDKGQQVWGATKGGYEFVKTK